VREKHGVPRRSRQPPFRTISVLSDDPKHSRCTPDPSPKPLQACPSRVGPSSSARPRSAPAAGKAWTFTAMAPRPDRPITKTRPTTRTLRPVSSLGLVVVSPRRWWWCGAVVGRTALRCHRCHRCRFVCEMSELMRAVRAHFQNFLKTS
jgi:hypothetical protein